MTRILPLFAALLLLLAACGGDSQTGGDTTGPGSDTADSGGDTSTGGDGTSDAAGGDADTTPTTPACQDDSDCKGAGEVCACTGLCVVAEGAPCENTKNCGGTLWCNPCLGRCEQTLTVCEPCQPVTSCDDAGVCSKVSGGPCRDGGACIAFSEGGSFCGETCLSKAGCRAGFDCKEVPGAADKQCVPSIGTCIDLGLCEDDGECPDNKVCNQGLCGQGCTDDGDCTIDTICQKGRCVPPCTSNAECTAPAECDDVSGRCKIPGACEASSECAPESYCDKLTGDCIPGCLIDAHCQTAAKVCEAMKCVPKGCEHNYQCGFNKVCDKTQGDCIESTRDDCATCDAMSQTPQCGGEPNLCATFQDEDMNPLGDFCLLLCEDDEIDKCPQGYQCNEIQTQEGMPGEFYCTRSCPDDPLSVGGTP